VELVADRFVVNDRRDARDLSTGDRVELIVSARGGTSEHARWAVRCGRFATLHHRAIARLLDYGPLGEVRRFEAWRTDGAWRGARRVGTRTIACASEFCRATAWTAGAMDVDAIRVVDGRPVILPDAAAGFDREGPPVGVSVDSISPDVLGLTTIGQDAVVALADLFRDNGESRSRAIALSGPPGAGMDTAIAELARAARLRGYIPIGLRAIGATGKHAASLLANRSIVLIVRSNVSEGWRALIHLSLLARKPHIVIFAGNLDVRHLCTITLGRQSVDTIHLSVQPRDVPAPMRARIGAAAHRAKGLPGRFAALLWGTDDMHEPSDRPRPLRAAEHAAAYGQETSAALAVEGQLEPSEWPAPGELSALRRRLLSGMALLESGRHASGDRAVRHVAGFLARRHDWVHATRANLALAESLVRRGRLRDAHAMLADARQSAAHASQNDALAQIAVLSGVAATDEGRLDDAEAVLSAAVSAARGLGEPGAGRAASLALARCLFWRGKFQAAEQSLADIELAGLPDTDAVRLAGLRSRLAVGRGDLREAVIQARSALERGQASACPTLIGAAAYAAAFAHLAVGDSAAVSAHVEVALHAARRAHDPLLSLRARLLGAESQRREGRQGPAATICDRLARMAPGRLPAIVRARADLLADLLAENQGRDVATRRVQATGLAALALFAPPRAESSVSARVEDIVDILRCCQTADEDASVLAGLCARLRRRLEAVAVAVFVAERGAFVPVAADGGKIDPAVAVRVSAVEGVLAPHHLNGRVEGGAPVRYGGRLVGAIVARWTPAGFGDFKTATLLLGTAATAAGPALAGVASHRIVPLALRGSDLLGTSAAIADVRRGVERAAPAPFAVLVVGESGSGKELVARALHRQSPRRDRPFCTLNCAALPEDLVESELFGHSRGAFTGAVAERPGVFEEAHSGTLFLDEIGELSLRAQAKILRTIQEGDLRRVGENIARKVDVRLVAATNRDLGQEVQAGRFRLDLLYRLDVIRIALPPLRDRREDIALLAEHFWTEATARVGSRATLGLATLARLARYDWPGNVRELQNVLAALSVRSPRRGVIPPSALPPHFDGAGADGSWRLDAARRTFETQFIRAALARTGGHRVRAAEELGVTRQGLTKLMSRLGISDDPGTRSTDD
jgi:DNA-binding NtrC family response regulator/tetratricopeptide (TPR) repeat protein